MKYGMINSNLKGQSNPIMQLNQALEDSSKMAHAYLFQGPPGLGKNALAFEFAHALLGSDMNHNPDLMILEKQGSTIRIAEIRNLQEWLTYKPYRAERRVAVIPEAHLMSNEAANAFLKTLEEPAGPTVLIMTADKETLPATVVSRCRVIRFMPLSWEEVAEILVEHGIDKDRAKTLAVISEGSPGRALALAEIDLEGLLQKTAGLLKDLLKGDAFTGFEMAEALDKDPARREAVLAILDIYCRDALFYANGFNAGVLLLSEDLAAELAGTGTGSLREVMRLVAGARQNLNGNANPLLTMVNMFLKIGEVAKEVV